MKYDCIIIGAGPGGLSAAIYLGRAGRKVLLVYAGPRRTAHAVHIQNYFGFDDITGAELIEKGIAQAKKYGVEFSRATVKMVSETKNGFEVSTAKETFLGRRVIVASGINDILPDIDNMFEFLGRSFFTCLDCDGNHFFDKKICLIGKGDHAAETALVIKKEFRADVSIVNALSVEDLISEKFLSILAQAQIPFINKKITHLDGIGGMIGSVTLEDGNKIKCDYVYSTLGYARNDGFLEGLDLERSESGYIQTNEHYESSAAGLFVIGPINTGPDQVSVAVGEGAHAAMHVIKLDYEY